MQQVYSSKGFMLVRSLNPDTEDEDESNHEEAPREKFLFGLTLKVRRNCSFQSFRIQVNSFIYPVPTKFNKRFITVTST